MRFIIANFLLVGVAEAPHYVTGLAAVNAFGFDYIGLQLAFFAGGIVFYILLTSISCHYACRDSEKIDL